MLIDFIGGALAIAMILAAIVVWPSSEERRMAGATREPHAFESAEIYCTGGQSPIMGGKRVVGCQRMVEPEFHLGERVEVGSFDGIWIKGIVRAVPRPGPGISSYLVALNGGSLVAVEAGNVRSSP